MAQFDSFAPFSHTHEGDVAQETQRYALSFEEEILQYRQSQQQRPPRQARQSYPLQEPKTEQLVNVTEPVYDISPNEAIPTPYLPTTRTLPSVATTPSLVSALRSTIQPAMSTRSRVVVIPGARKTVPLQPQSPVVRKRLHPQLRLGIIMGMMLFMFCATLLSLAPLSDAQHGGVFFLTVMDGGQTRQYAWSIPSHDATVQQGAAVTNGNAVGGGGTNAGAAPVAPPPVFLPKSQYVAIAQQDAIAAGISPDYFVRQINQESGFNPNAYSPAGAIGIAQFIPSTAAGLGINPYDPVQALRGAANLMASYARQYNGDYAKALAAYNAGGGTVNYAVNTCGTSWLSCLPGETRNYIRVIMGI